jgi:hypothetical protein
MDEEPWDEVGEVLGMRTKTNLEEPPHAPYAPPQNHHVASLRGMSAKAPPPPPAAAFRQVDPPANQFSFQKKNTNDEDLRNSTDSGGYNNNDIIPADQRLAIRQEALKLLEVCDDSMANSPYIVHRTVTGGYSAEPRGSEAANKRTPSALKGLQFTASRANAGRRFRDNPWNEDAEEVQTSRSSRDADYEYGEEETMDTIDIQPQTDAAASSTAHNWSSRYSIDNTILALGAGRTASQKSALGDADKQQQQRSSVHNGLFASSPHSVEMGNVTGNSVFGSGAFSFRQKHVFGKSPHAHPNLHDGEWNVEPTLLRKSWQEQKKAMQRRKRICLLLLVAVLVFVITLTTLLKKRAAARAASAQLANEVVFDIVSNVPYTITAENQLRQDIASIPSSTNFLVHLGNIQDIGATLCSSSQYLNVADILKTSAVATFIVPGEEDWPNCPDPGTAWTEWYKNFALFDHNFYTSMAVDRQTGRLENFAFVEKDVLFLGLHIVNGRLYSSNELLGRSNDNIAWIKAMLQVQGGGARAIVVFGNAKPGLTQNEYFFKNMASLLDAENKPVLYVHSPSGSDGSAFYSPFNAQRVTALQGQGSTPLQVRVGFGANPFTLG